MKRISNFEEAVKAVTMTGTGTVVAAQAGRLRHLDIDASGGGAGQIVFRDGGVGGAIILDLAVPASATETDVNIPGLGIKFSTDLHISVLTNITSITCFFGEDALGERDAG